jgi:hypothetical protein
MTASFDEWDRIKEGTFLVRKRIFEEDKTTIVKAVKNFLKAAGINLVYGRVDLSKLKMPMWEVEEYSNTAHYMEDHRLVYATENGNYIIIAVEGNAQIQNDHVFVALVNRTLTHYLVTAAWLRNGIMTQKLQDLHKRFEEELEIKL